MPERKKSLAKRGISLILAAAIMTASGMCPVLSRAAGTVTADAAVKTRVVVLDPGHGGREKGACYFGMQEKVLNLKIAKYCQAELARYANVKVIMTRTSDRAVSNAGLSADLQARSRIAKNNHADLFVCLHNNAFGEGESAATNGVRVYHQNNSFYANVGAQSKKLAQILARRIAGCGLTNGGARTRYSDDRSRRDPSGKKGDYYGVLFYNKTYRIPAVIVEHAFMSNKSDAAKLKDEAFLKRLGQADAAGIAEYLGLKKTGKFNTGWYRSSGKTYYFDSNGYKLTGWQILNKKRYYFSVKDGHMLTGLQKIGTKYYYLSSQDGHMMTGLQTIGSKKYYFNTKTGVMMTGWQIIGGKKYYFSVKDGRMLTGRQWIGGRIYTFTKDGVLKK
jgi:N-acetylmuramoyl-L-alanine amidase